MLAFAQKVLWNTGGLQQESEPLDRWSPLHLRCCFSCQGEANGSLWVSLLPALIKALPWAQLQRRPRDAVWRGSSCSFKESTGSSEHSRHLPIQAFSSRKQHCGHLGREGVSKLKHKCLLPNKREMVCPWTMSVK